ncbi:MAG: rRNA maturation RNase YbeY [Bradymonadaceae bacterium]
MDLEAPHVSVVLAGDDVVRELNEEWRGEQQTTDVLSFPLHAADESPADHAHLGDIVINVEYAERLVGTDEHRHRVAGELEVPPEELQWELDDEVEFLFIHALLHLLGYDHAEPDEEREMRRKEVELFRSTGEQGAGNRE